MCDPPAPPLRPSPLSVSELALSVKTLLHRATANREERTGHPAYVRGEIIGATAARSGYIYFDIKDNTARIRCIVPPAVARRLAYQITDGLEVLACFSLDLFERNGSFQLRIRELVLLGDGELALVQKQLAERLGREGLFNEGRKRRLPHMCTRVGIITSRDSRAFRDIETVIRRRFPPMGLFCRHVALQGPTAASEIGAALGYFSSPAVVDCVVLTRGGGDIQALSPFDSEEVVRAIAASAVPVVSAVGHEADRTLADEVADRRAATPSEAGELVSRDLAQTMEDSAALREGLNAAFAAHVRSECVHARRALGDATRNRLTGRRSVLADDLAAVLRRRLSARSSVLRLEAAKALEKRRAGVGDQRTRAWGLRSAIDRAFASRATGRTTQLRFEAQSSFRARLTSHTHDLRGRVAAASRQRLAGRSSLLRRQLGDALEQRKDQALEAVVLQKSEELGLSQKKAVKALTVVSASLLLLLMFLIAGWLLGWW